MKLNFLKNSKNIFLPTICYFYLNYQNKSYCFNELDDNMKKLILKKKTDVYIWGKGHANGTSIYSNFHPHRIKKFINNMNTNLVPEDIIDIAFGEHLAACIDKNYNLFVWNEPKLNSEKNVDINNHERVNILNLAPGLKIVNFSFTKDKLFILDGDGNVYMYNIIITPRNKEDFFLDSVPDPEVKIDNNFIKIKELQNIISISTGKDHIIALDKDGKLYGMGDDSYGQLGQANYTQQREQQMKTYNNFIERRERLPKKIEISEKIKKIVCGENHTLALSEGGNVYGFGYNRFLQISNDPLYRLGLIGLCKPTIIPAEKFNNMKVIDISACRNTSYFTCLNEINKTYHFFSSGEGLRGQLGQNLIKHLSDIEEMPDISGLVNSQNMKPFEPMKLKCGLNHCLLLFKNPRVLYVWGNNEFGELGTKDRVFYESPIPMLEEYILPFNIINFGVGHTNSAFICEKIDKKKKKQILEEDKKMYEEEMSKKKIKKKKIKIEKEKNPDEELSFFQISFYQLIKNIKKYL